MKVCKVKLKKVPLSQIKKSKKDKSLPEDESKIEEKKKKSLKTSEEIEDEEDSEMLRLATEVKDPDIEDELDALLGND